MSKNHKRKKNSFLIQGLKMKMCILFSILSLVVISQATKAQEEGVVVKGKLTSTNGEAIPFATVVEKGTNHATTTDIDGNYSIKVGSPESILVFSFVGYTPQEVKVGNQTDISVKLAEDKKTQIDVVVVGYGKQKKRDITGSTESVGNKDLRDRPVVGFAEAMQGKASGVQVMQNSGQPGGGATIRVRGVGTINNADPLVVVDGFPINGGLSAIDPNTIEKIDVLKDASAAAIYGARGANGVIIVTTKKGVQGKPQVNFHTYHGTNSPIRIPKLLNGSEYAQFHNEMMVNGGKKPNAAFNDYAQYGEGTNWLNEIFKTAKVDYYGMDISGATDKNNYAVSASYLNQEGTIINSGYQRLNAQINYSTVVNDKLTFGTTNTMAHENYIPVNVIGDALSMLPVLPVFNPDGSYSGPKAFSTYGDALNPVAQANEFKNSENKYRLISNAYAEYKPIKNLTLRSQVGMDIDFEKKRSWVPKYKWGFKTNDLSSLWQSRDDNMIFLWDNTATYDKTFNDHKVTAMVGLSTQSYKGEYFNGKINNFPNPATQQSNNGVTPVSVGGTYWESALLSGLSRINYSFKDKYLATVNFRYDGSSRFGSNYRFGAFPSASFAWRISDENFFATVKEKAKINDLKLRLGYGFTGNQEIGNYSYTNLIATNLKYSFGNTITGAAAPISLANPNVHWESTAQFNTGLDIAFLEDRFSVTIDYYNKNTYGMLQQRPIAAFIGLPGARPYVNIGQIRNQGIEVSLNGTILNSQIGGQTFKWVSNFNITANKNEVVELYNGVPLYGENVGLNRTLATTEEGHPIGTFYGYQTDGIFQNQSEVEAHAKQNPGTDPTISTAPGDFRFKDLNGDGIINEKDRTYLGSPFPSFFYGFTNTFSYLGFDLTIFLQGVQGNKIYNVNRMFNESMSAVQNQYATVKDRWTGEGTSNVMPRAVYGDPNGNARVSDRFIEDGSYFRIKSVSLGYTIPQTWSNKAHLRSVNIYMSSQNLLTFTKYTGFDPEVGPNGVDWNQYPVYRSITFGVKLGL